MNHRRRHSVSNGSSNSNSSSGSDSEDEHGSAPTSTLFAGGLKKLFDTQVEDPETIRQKLEGVLQRATNANPAIKIYAWQRLKDSSFAFILTPAALGYRDTIRSRLGHEMTVLYELREWKHTFAPDGADSVLARQFAAASQDTLAIVKIAAPQLPRPAWETILYSTGIVLPVLVCIAILAFMMTVFS